MPDVKKRNKKKIIVLSVIGVLVITFIVLAILGTKKEEVIIVQTEFVKKRDITQTVTATGKIEPEFKVVITPEVSGEIVYLPVKEGQRVRKGDILLKIKQDQYLAQRDRAVANLSSARSNLTIQRIQLQKIEADYNRVRELFSKGLSSEAELEAIKAQFETAKAQVQSAESTVQQMEAMVKEANENLAKTIITSPMDGVVSQLNVKLGERVLGTGFTQGSNLMTVADLTKMVAVVDVDENDVVLVSIGDTARVKVDAFPGKIFSGVVYEIGNTAKAKGLGTQEEVVNFEVKIRILNSDVELKPGMSCNVEIMTETRKNVLAVPIQSVTIRGLEKEKKDEKTPEEDIVSVESKKEEKDTKNLEGVFIVKDGKAKFVKVKTGISDDTYIEIISGLKGDEEVVTGSYRAISRELKDGSRVRVENKKSGTSSKS
ncbi:MAG: efflux RND transporter periplasmic adaptor subunit [Ignavibacteria bacterium]|nr:efflux RND transporter periplasmic adaptor subunit [Ignavibacteria bacterium]